MAYQDREIKVVFEKVIVPFSGDRRTHEIAVRSWDAGNGPGKKKMQMRVRWTKESGETEERNVSTFAFNEFNLLMQNAGAIREALADADPQGGFVPEDVPF